MVVLEALTHAQCGSCSNKTGRQQGLHKRFVSGNSMSTQKVHPATHQDSGKGLTQAPCHSAAMQHAGSRVSTTVFSCEPCA
jgi:hypothetical protein